MTPDLAAFRATLPTAVIGTPATNHYQVMLAGDPATGLLHIGQASVHQDVELTSAVHIAPLLALLTRDLGLRFTGGPTVDPDTYEDQRRLGWRLLTATGEQHVLFSTYLEAPEAQVTDQGTLIVEPSNYPAYLNVAFTRPRVPGHTSNENAAYRAHDIVDALTTLFPLTVTDPRNVLTRHLRPAPPAFEVFDDGTTAPVTAGRVR